MAFPLKRTDADFVGVGDAIIALIAKPYWLWGGNCLCDKWGIVFLGDFRYASGGSKMYRSRTISQA